jgi:hypothetical protein
MRGTWVCALCVLGLAGCASNGVRGPAATISSEVTSFRGSLSDFQTQENVDLATESDRTTGDTIRANAATEATSRLQVQWALVNAKSVTDAFTTLQDQGRAEAALALAPTPSSAPPKVSLPLDKLAHVVTVTKALTQPRTAAQNLAFLAGFGSKVATGLSGAKLSPSAATPSSGAGAAAAPAKAKGK